MRLVPLCLELAFKTLIEWLCGEDALEWNLLKVGRSRKVFSCVLRLLGSIASCARLILFQDDKN